MKTIELQRMLIALGYDLGRAGADGAFGPLTRAAVRKFQSDYKVDVRWPGTVGAKTEAALRAAYASKTGDPAQPVGAPLLPWFDTAERLKGVKEVAGKGSNPVIMGWASRLGGWVKSFFTDDDIPWCGLFVAHCITSTLPDEPIPSNPLGAKNWQAFGVGCKPQPGALLVFSRDGGGHVGFYVGEDSSAFHVLGGNQNNMVNVTRVAKYRHIATRWPKTVNPPTGKAVHLTAAGKLSTNEA